MKNCFLIRIKKFGKGFCLLFIRELLSNDLVEFSREYLWSQNLKKTLYYHCAFLMMSYSFTDPEDEEESSEINLVEGEVEKPEPRRFMLPVGDLLNHTWDNNARIEFGDDCLTINATKVPILIKTNPNITQIRPILRRNESFSRYVTIT